MSTYNGKAVVDLGPPRRGHARRAARANRRRYEPRPSQVRPHRFDADATTPPDRDGLPICRWCGLPGEAGDDRHPADAPPVLPPVPADVAETTARIVGERP